MAEKFEIRILPNNSIIHSKNQPLGRNDYFEIENSVFKTWNSIYLRPKAAFWGSTNFFKYYVVLRYKENSNHCDCLFLFRYVKCNRPDSNYPPIVLIRAMGKTASKRYQRVILDFISTTSSEIRKMSKNDCIQFEY